MHPRIQKFNNYLIVFLLTCCTNAYSASSKKTDLIVYSYDRPMQLYAFLESVERYVKGIKDTFAIVRTSDADYQKAYQVVKERFSHVQFIYQKNPFDDLKQITLECFNNDTPYILFGVDDIIIKDYITLEECINALETYDAHGFFFRLGKNLNSCFSMSCEQPLPPLIDLPYAMYLWIFNQGMYDWNYQNNLDFTLYRKTDLESPLKNSHYKTPYSLESGFMSYRDPQKYGICYETSKIINFPLNVVQSDWPNAHTNIYGTQKLLSLFNKGLKIDIQSLEKIDNKSAHSNVTDLIRFIPRETQLKEKPIVIVTPSYNNKDWWKWNLNNSLNQNYHNYHIIITDDCSSDGTGKAIEEYIQINGLQDKVTLIKNKERKGALHNLYTMIHSCINDAIIIAADGDDALHDPEVLSRINEIYSTKDVWLTYGQFIEHPSGTKGWCTPMPQNIVENNEFRKHPDLPSHLRTFYAWLFKAIKLEDLLYNGDFYPMTWDYAMMFPMLEMAGEHHYCFEDEILYIYNNANSISDHRISRQLQAHLAQIVRAKNSYSPLNTPVKILDKHIENEKVDFIIFSETGNPQLLNELLVSLQQHCTGFGEVYILYIYNESTVNGYNHLQEKFHTFNFVKVDEERENFKALFTKIYRDSLTSNYIAFSTDKALFIDSINLTDCIKALEQTQAYCFSLSLAKDNASQSFLWRLPILEIKPDICAWNFAFANDVWSAANNINLCIYRRPNSQILDIIQEDWTSVCSSRDLQGWWSQDGNLNKIGLCFKHLKISNT